MRVSHDYGPIGTSQELAIRGDTITSSRDVATGSWMLISDDNAELDVTSNREFLEGATFQVPLGTENG